MVFAAIGDSSAVGPHNIEDMTEEEVENSTPRKDGIPILDSWGRINRRFRNPSSFPSSSLEKSMDFSFSMDFLYWENSKNG